MLKTEMPKFFVIRTPFFPFPNILRFKIDDLLVSKTFLECIHLSSPSLSEEISKYRLNQLSAKEKDKFEQTLTKFFLRAGYRCTPFGLFAGISLGSFSTNSNVKLESVENYKRNLRLDTHFLSSVARSVQNISEIKNSLLWYTNNTLYTVKETLRFIESKIDKNSRTHYISSVSDSEYIQLILKKSKHGAKISQLVEELTPYDISANEAEDFINELISNQLLVCELDPIVTGPYYQNQLIQKLENNHFSRPYLEKLLSMDKVLLDLDKKSIGVSLDEYKKLNELANSFNIPFDPGKFLHASLSKPVVSCELNKVIIEELKQSLFFLNEIQPTQETSDLQTFIEEFIKKNEDQEKSFLEVIDNQTGIGYPVRQLGNFDRNPLMADLSFLNHHEPASYPANNWFKYLAKKVHDAISNGATEIDITDSEVKALKLPESNNQLANSCYTLCSVIADSNQEIDQGNFKIYHDVTGGPSAANLLGRFCNSDDRLLHFLKAHLEMEEAENPECVFAEILHIPDTRLDSVVNRPVLRKYEIPILTLSTRDEDHTILLSDLMISVVDNRVILRSKKLNKEIRPRLSTAHNFSDNQIPHYKFLCDLQFQGVTGGLTWNWGFLNELPFLPRVQYGKTILAKARWVMTMKEGNNKQGEELISELAKYLEKSNVPTMVTISKGDHQLPINIRNKNCLKILAQELTKHEILVLEECLFNSENLFVESEEGKFTNEIIIPWHKISNTKNKNFSAQRKSNQISGESIQRSFNLGSEWYYSKIYCGFRTADQILTDAIGPLTNDLLNEGVINKFFFIRYNDPDHHLRIRFKGTANFFTEAIVRMNKALAPFLEASLIFNIQSETYHREIERYGEENMDISESIFQADSTAIIELLSFLEGDEGDQLRWQLAMKGVNDLLDAFGLDTVLKRDLTERLSAKLAEELQTDNHETRKQLSTKYREFRKILDLILGKSMDVQNEVYQTWKILEIRKQSLSKYAASIHALIQDHKLSIHLNDLLASYTHMFLNRMFRSKQRTQEMIIYDLLCQHYKISLAKSKVKVA